MTSSRSRKSVDSVASPSSQTSAPQLPFSQVDSPTPRRPRYDSRRGSTASSTSIGGRSLSTFQNDSIVEESSQNAISSLLQPPIVRTGLLPHTSAPSGGYKPPSSKDIPPVTLTNIPHVDSKSFQSYLSQIGSLYESLHRAKDPGDQQDRQDFRKNVAVPKPSELDPLSRPQLDTLSPDTVSRSVDYPGATRRSSTSSRNRGQATTPLSTIPNVYFDEDFHLENPRTFDIVSERSEVISSRPKRSGSAEPGEEEPRPTNRKALATNAILLEKLSWYLDTVEVHLITSISAASTSFFTALGSLRELHAEAASSVQKIQTLRADLSSLDKDMALGGLNVVQMRRRRHNVRKLADAVSQLEEVISAVNQCEILLDEGDIDGAIDVLDDVERLVAGELPLKPRQASSDIIDLRGIKALEGASDDLNQLRYRIGTGYEKRFLDCLMADLRRHVENVSHEATLLRLGASFQRSRGSHMSTQSGVPSYINIDDQMRRRLRLELAGLGRSRHTMPATTAFKNVVLRELKSLIRRNLPSSSDDDNESIMSASTHGGRQLNQQEKSVILARNLRAMDADDAYSMLTNMYTGISELMRRLSVQVKVLLDITSGVGSPARSPTMPSLNTATSPTPTAAIAKDEILQVLDMSSLLGHAVDIVHSQVVKVLKVRSEQTEKLSLEQFLRYFTLNRLFADECEAISGRSGEALKNVVDNHIRSFISSFADSQRHRLVQIMDSDRWDAKDFGDRDNVLLARVLEATTKDAEVWSATSRIWQPFDDSNEALQNSNGSAVNGNGAPSGGKDRVRSAVIDEQRYLLPESAVSMLGVLEQFLHLITGIPSMTFDIATNILECLKLFNSRSSQLILGAGATRSAGLKNITTKHLALASQALSFITAVIPYLREFVRRHCTTNSILADFDKVKRLYQEHQSGIHEKLVDIMSSRASIHVKSMGKMDWDGEKDPSAVSPYMETLAKETGTLHRVLGKHLPEMTVSMIMGPVFASYKEQLSMAFQSVNLKSETTRQRLLSDVNFFKTKMEKIEGATALADQLVEIINAKAVVAAPGSEPTPEPSHQDVPSTSSSPPAEVNESPENSEQ